MLLKIGHQEISDGSGHDAAYAVLKKLWQEEIGGSFPQIACTKRGKPYFVDTPVYFSITHTKNHAFCVLSDVPVGIDAEEVIRKIKPTLAEKVLSPGEYRQYLAAEDKNRALLTFWVLKEAAAKCTGEGIRIHPTHTDFSLQDLRVKEIHGCLVAVVQEQEKENAF